jgi:translocation and assembly module TamB
LKRALRWLAILLAALSLLAGGFAFLADTDIGHRYIADKIASQTPKSGLQIRVGRIDGSIYSKASIHGLELYDPQGQFFVAPHVTLDWHPLRWFSNALDIESLSAETAMLRRLPKLRPGAPNQPILPGFDIRIGSLSVKRLEIGAGVAGKARNGMLSGRADIQSGRALIDLNVDAAEGDRLVLKLDAEPDRNKFDVKADLNAPSGGVFGAVLGTLRPVSAKIDGDGSWKDWRGTLSADVSGVPVAQLSLAALDGHYLTNGMLQLETLTQGKVQRLTAPLVRLRGDARLENRRLSGTLGLASDVLVTTARGTLNLEANAFRDVRIDAKLLRNDALFPNMGGAPVTLAARLDGPFARAWFDYLLASPRVTFDQTGFDDIRLSGQGHFSPSPVTVPVHMTAKRVTGVGDVAGGILANLSVEGLLRVTPKLITGDGLAFKSDKLSGKLTLLVDLVTGRYDVGIAGQLQRYLIPGLGIVDVKSELQVVPGVAGKGSRVLGHGQAWVRRFDNGFLAGLAGGLPMLDTGLERDADGVLHFINLKITAPSLMLTGNGLRRRDGSFHVEGSGRQARYGPFTLKLDGRIERPKLDIVLAHPNAAMGLSNVRLLLDPNEAGFAYTASGGSRIGPFTSRGTVLTPKSGETRIAIDDLDASGLHAKGVLTPQHSGLEGQLALNGSGISGSLLLSPAGEDQRIEAHLNARDAALNGPPRMAIRRGKLDGFFLVGEGGTTSDATITGEGMAYGSLTLARLAANVKMKGGTGVVRASFAGSRGRIFDLQTVAQISPGAMQIIGSGSIDRKPIRLASAANLKREGDGWRMQPTSLEFAGGQARVSGLIGGSNPEIEAVIQRMPMTILDVFYPRLGMGGVASGSLSYRFPDRGAPSGKADLKIRGLSRAGLVLTSQPVDVAVAGVLNGSSGGARMIAQSGGQEIGRAQLQLTSILSGGDLFSRLASAPLFAQLRFNGAAGTLWRLTGIESFDLQGPVAIGADIGGTLANPQIRGSLRTTNARIESAVTGMVLTNVHASGRFGGSSLIVDSFAADAGAGGTVAGKGSFDLAARSGFGMNIDMQASHAVVLARDDLGATVTGPISIRSDGAGGVISGQLVLDRSRFRLGRATSASAVPQLNVREINGRSTEAIVRALPLPWRLDMSARAPNRLSVTGLGLDSEWKADLKIGGTVYSPAIQGRADLLRGGYEFAGRRFDLQRGSIRFLGESPPDPILDIAASGDTQGLSATIRVTGTGLKPDIAFSSTPALPQDELLSRLLFGTSITNLSAPEAVQLAAAIASLRNGGGLDPINALRSAIGLDRLRILPADATTGQRTSIAVGKYLTRRAYVEIITDGQGYSATRAEFQITRWLSLLSSISTIGRQSAQVRISKDY